MEEARKAKEWEQEGQIETPNKCKVIPTQTHQKMCVTKGWAVCVKS